MREEAVVEMSYDQLHEIAAKVAEIRPDWEVGNVLNSLLSLKDRGTTAELTVAAIRAAKDHTARTPAAIGFPVHWAPPRKPPATQTVVVANPLPECKGCGTPRRRNDRDGHPLPPPDWCKVCNAPWEEFVFRRDPERERREAVPPNAAFRGRTVPRAWWAEDTA